MKWLALFSLCLIWFALNHASCVFSQVPDRPELRGFWVDGFNDGFHTPAECDLLLARVRAAHMNAVFVEVRKRGDAYYASHYEPWATDDPQHFDALAYLCQQAHMPGQPYVQVHAWLNVCAVGANTLARQHPDWLSVSDTGSVADGEDVKIDPGNPDAADWTVRVLLDVVRHDDIDGLHLDAIRYGGSGANLGHWGYNAVSVARYNARYGTTGQPPWNDPRWMQWRRDQVTDLVRRISVMAHALKPHLIVSAATICWGDAPQNEADYRAKSAAYTEVFADWQGWLREGLLDLNCPMMYFNQTRHPTYWPQWADFVKDHQYGRISTLGVGGYLNDTSNALAQIASAHLPSALENTAAGVTLFSYASTDSVAEQEQQFDLVFYNALPCVFPQDAPTPPMPWLDTPKTGAIMGTLLQGASLNPVDGMHIVASASGHTYNVISDGNGFFAFTGLPPGSYDIRFHPQTAGTAVFTQFLVGVGVNAGPTWIPLVFIPPVSGCYKFDRTVDGIGRLPEKSQVILSSVPVSVGSDVLKTDFYVLGPGDHFPLRVHMLGLTPPTVAGDIVAVSGTLHHTRSGTVIDASIVRLIGIYLIHEPKSGIITAPERRLFQHHA
jgi:uncharacterized lipoprotein YddW (UPF0748 family)